MDENIYLFIQAFGIGFGAGIFVGFFCAVFGTVIKFFYNLFKRG